MSKREDPNIPDYFPISSLSLKIDKVLSFDCFVYLEKNGKLVHWMREGAIFTISRQQKLLGVGNPPLLVRNDQKGKYEIYISDSDSDADEINSIVSVTDGSIRVFGSARAEPQQNMFHFKGDRKSEPSQPQAKQSAPKMKVDVEFLNTVIMTTQQVFQDYFSIPLKFQAPTRRTGNGKKSISVEIASFTALNSQTIRGTVGLCFPSATYLYLLCQATGFTYKELTPELCLGCGEFMHLVFETARPKLIEQGYPIDRAVPALVVGQDLSIPHIIPDKGFSITFESAGGPFQFEVGLKTGG